MMKLYGALILFLTLSAACGLRCYVCIATTDPKSCTKIITCPGGFNYCGSVTVNGLTTKSCLNSAVCANSAACCKGDLCNNAIPTGPSVILLLVSSAIITLFL